MALSSARIAKLEKAIAQIVSEKNAQLKPQEAPTIFPQQAAFLEDPSRQKLLFCTRRAGKSWVAGLLLCLKATTSPGSVSFFAALTRESAKHIIWNPILKVINRLYSLRARFNESELSVKFPNGSMIYLMGVDADEDQRNKLLGQALALGIFDECAVYRTDLVRLLFEVLGPALIDHDGTVVLMGVANNFRRGYFYELTKDQDPQVPGTFEVSDSFGHKWSGHKWGASQNPYIAKNWAKKIAELIANNPRVVETPWFVTQYLGRWSRDQSRLIYKYQNELNDFDGRLPEYKLGAWHMTLAVDLAHSPDSSAFTVTAWHDYDPITRIIESKKQLKMDFTDVANRIKLYQAKYPGIERVIVDGANKQGVAELQNRHGLALTPADKRDKVTFIEIMNGEFHCGKILVNATMCQDLIAEWADLIWDPKAIEKKEHPGCHNDCADTALYAWRFNYAYFADEHPKAKTLEEMRQQDTEQQEQQITAYWESEDEKLRKRQLDESELWGDILQL